MPQEPGAYQLRCSLFTVKLEPMTAEKAFKKRFQFCRLRTSEIREQVSTGQGLVSAHLGGSSQGLPRSSLCSLRTRALSPALVHCTRVYRGGPGLLAAWRSGGKTARGGGFFSLDGCPAGMFRLVTLHFPLAGLFGERGEMTGSSNLGRWPAVGEASSPTRRSRSGLRRGEEPGAGQTSLRG